jgi:predicted metal-dependent peptidase
MELDPATARMVSAALLRVCSRNPFLATLALFARFEVSTQVPTAATDGRDIFVNPAFFHSLTPPEHDALLLHEVLHAALLHVPRRGGRDPKAWNVAADIVVNGMLAKEGYQLPAGGLRDTDLEHLGVEEVYELLLRDPDRKGTSSDPGQGEGDGADPGTGKGQGEGDQPATGQGDDPADLLAERPDDATPAEGGAAERKAAEQHWKQALQQANMVAESSQHGNAPAGLARELRALREPRLDWRSILWRYLVHTPTDFQGFDRRFVGQRLYLETVQGEMVRVAVAVDTSGSINEGALAVFLGELRGILRSYPHLSCDLYYADTELHGPYRLSPRHTLPPPIGGGGTDFRPFFDHLARRRDPLAPSVAVYLTDGYGDFPATPPACPTLWVVTPGGCDLDHFPFGQAVRLLPHTS